MPLVLLAIGMFSPIIIIVVDVNIHVGVLMLSSLGQCNHGTDFYFATYQRQVWAWWDGHLHITTLSPNNVAYHIENSTAIINPRQRSVGGGL